MAKSTLVVTCAAILYLGVGNLVQAQSDVKIDPATGLQWYVSNIHHPTYVAPQHREFDCSGGMLEIDYSAPWDVYSVTQVTPSTPAVTYGDYKLKDNLYTNVVESSPSDTTPWTGDQGYAQIRAKFHGFTKGIPVSYYLYGQWSPPEDSDDHHWTGFHTSSLAFYIHDLVP